MVDGRQRFWTLLARKSGSPRSGNTAGIPRSFSSASSQLSVPSKDLRHTSSLSSTISPPLFLLRSRLCSPSLELLLEEEIQLLDVVAEHEERERLERERRERQELQLLQEAYHQPPAQLSQDNDEILSIRVPYGRVNTEEIYGIVWPTHRRHGSADHTAIIPRSTSVSRYF
ncbi:hypothetical protein B0H17DRAFT_1144240 [Mycena rosella]|uniref:Uncharacterized protein n=1 Tax=Mycena rosella TaxID=1033263 RepID=A0AAD7CTL7_MYCRO|nr:hypothetical protein B0H17DRAFT_1144240 [Mycena rosella]